jgi:hypothetical protein
VVESVNTTRLAKAWGDVRNFIDGADYLWFLSEFIFKMKCPRDSLFDQLSKPNRVYFGLIPDGYREELLRQPEITKSGNKIIYLNDEGLFWRKPAGRPSPSLLLNDCLDLAKRGAAGSSRISQ